MLTDSERTDLVKFWTEEQQVLSDHNIKSRSNQKAKHTMGNFPRCKAEMVLFVLDEDTSSIASRIFRNKKARWDRHHYTPHGRNKMSCSIIQRANRQGVEGSCEILNY